jgi:endonuclease/exonuclease/phosphatase family metal-dependent hydrolase
VRFILCGLSVILWGIVVQASFANTGTFLDRQRRIDLRVVSYNVLFETIFPEENMAQADKFERVVQALDPDVLNLQEIRTHSAADVVTLLNGIAPLPGGATWYAHQGDDNIIASKYPLSLTATNTVPPKDGTSIALVDLPDDRFDKDLYVMNNHFTCCTQMNPPVPLDANEASRQSQADALVNWMRDARTPGGNIDLPQDTPMLVVGDLNIVMDPDVYDPLGTLLSGDIFFEAGFGSDSPPDWDGTPLADSHPLHNATGPNDYTWRDDTLIFDPGRLDYILYTDSVLKEVHKFVLNTVDMTPEERLATGLLELDITVDQVGLSYDHLPIVVDFRFVPEPASMVYGMIALAYLLGQLRKRRR